MPESQEVSSESPEDVEPKANPFIPNPKAQWCPKCEAHRSDYDYSSYHSGSGGNSTIEDQYSCKVCKATMFIPAETLPWMYGTVGFGAFLLAIGLLIGLFKGEFDFKNGGPEAVLILFAIYCTIDWPNAVYLHEEVVRLVIRPKEKIHGRTGNGSHKLTIGRRRRFCRKDRALTVATSVSLH